ncbi:MAG: cyclase/dehydrase [Pedosphaera sp.]|nr:cyclase/dehydrase [Pedosphaera sp.]
MANNHTTPNRDEEKLARGLGWFSIGLGLAGLLAPRSLARVAGVRERPLLLRAIGLRELVSGVGILSERRPADWLWARVAGDAMDLSLLGVGLASNNPNKGRAAAATLAVAGITALDLHCSQRLSTRPGTGTIHLSKTITINRSAEDLYQFWHDFQSLPRFMNHLQEVQDFRNGRSHWVAKGPADTLVEWDAEIINDKPNELIAWCSVEGADVDNAGTVRFEPAAGGRGTVVKVAIEYRPPAGALGAKIAEIFGEAPEKQVHVDLHRFKQLMETGEIARTEGQPAGRSRSTSRLYDDFVRS